MPLTGPDVLLVDTPRPKVRRLTLNRPEKRNALFNELRARIFEELEAADLDPEVHVTVIRGAGPSFSAGYDLSADNAEGRPYHTARGGNDWARHVVEGWFRVWDLAKPVIAQVHGHCLAGGSELAAACDVVYVATRAFPLEQLEDATLAFAERVALVPPDVQQFNKRAVHRQMEAMGLRAGLRAGTEIQALAFTSESSRAYLSRFRRDGASVAGLVRERDKPFAPD